MTAHPTTAHTPKAAPLPRSRLRARIVLAGFAAVGLASLAWAAFVQPLPRLIYNPSDSVPVGWYRVDPLDHRPVSLPRPLSVGSIVLTRLPADRLGRPLPSWQHCRPLAEGELFLLSVTNPASFDSRYFGPVSASAVIGVAHPVWLETRP
ncbi:S26 family signal peptidase [Aeromonas caviae]